MKRVIYNGREYVISRIRDGIVELVNIETGEMKKMSHHEMLSQSASTIHDHHIGVLSSLVPFSQRPRSFLDELRQRRRTLLEEHKKARKVKINNGTKPSRKKKVSDMELLMAQFGLNGNAHTKGK